MTRKNSTARTVLINLGLVALAFGLLGLTVSKNQEKIREALTGPIDGRLFAVGFAIYMAAMILTFVRWYLLVRALRLPFRFRDAIRLGFIGSVFNLVIPGAVGGDLIKAGFLCREQARKTQAVSSLVVDRVLGLFALFLLAGLSGAFAWWGGTDVAVRRLIVVVWSALAIGAVGLLVLFTPALYAPIIRRLAGRGRLATAAEELVSMASSYRDRPGVIAVAVVISLVNHSLNVTAFYAVSLGLPFTNVPTLLEHFLMVPLALFTTAVPLPGGALGLSEQASERLFQLLGHPNGAVAMMAFRVLMYAGVVVSTGVYLANLGQVRKLAKAGDEALSTESVEDRLDLAYEARP